MQQKNSLYDHFLVEIFFVTLSNMNTFLKQRFVRYTTLFVLLMYTDLRHQLFLNSVRTGLVSETRRFNYFMPWLKCKPILLWHTVLDGRDILLSTFYRRYTFTHTSLLLNIPMSWEFTFLALQKNYSSVIVQCDSW